MKSKKQFYVGVRFSGRPTRIYTYTSTQPVKLGDELVVENEHGTSVVFVVRVDTKIPDYAQGVQLRPVTLKVVPI